MLRFHAEGGARMVNYAAFPRNSAIQVVGGIELQAGLRCEDFEEASSSWLMHARCEFEFARFLIEHPIVVVAFADFELLIILIDPGADRGRFAEIKGRSLDRAKFA